MTNQYPQKVVLFNYLNHKSYPFVDFLFQTHVQGRTLSLNEGKLSTSDVLYKGPQPDKSVSNDSEQPQTEEVCIIDETSKEVSSLTLQPTPQSTE